MKIKIYNRSSHEQLIKKSESASGYDLAANLGKRDLITIKPGAIVLVPTGIYVEIEPGYEMQIRPRSGRALQGLTVANAPGTIDADYRGEIKVMIHNISPLTKTISDGMRIAQAVFAKVESPEMDYVDTYEELSATKRGEGGFGHTGD